MKSLKPHTVWKVRTHIGRGAECDVRYGPHLAVSRTRRKSRSNRTPFPFVALLSEATVSRFGHDTAGCL